MDKDITRVQFWLEAKTKPQMTQIQLDYNLKRILEFEYSTPVWNESIKMYECWFYDSAKLRMQFQDKLLGDVLDEKETRKELKKSSI